MKYLQSKKGELGLDLGSWIINELHEVVKRFTKENSGIEDEKEEENINKEDDNNEIYDLDKFSKEHPVIIGSNEEYGKCAITNFTDKDNINIKVSEPEKVSGGIFSKSFILYTVEAQPFG